MPNGAGIALPSDRGAAAGKPAAGNSAAGNSAATRISAAAGILASAGIESARTDAELLAAFVLGVPRGRLALAPPFGPDQAVRYRDLVAARSRRIPLQHLTGTAPFRYLDLAVGPGVFIPRPETELLVDLALDPVRAVTGRPPVVVDLCGGSGAMALAVANEVPGARVYAVESGPAALRWLRRNAADRARAGDAEVTVVDADVTDPGLLDAAGLLAALVGAVDVVLCNPPYVPAGTQVAPEVADHDPDSAVFGGPDGLAVIRPVIGLTGRLLRGGGWFGVEHHETTQNGVIALVEADGRFTAATGHRDLAGRPRFVTARRR